MQANPKNLLSKKFISGYFSKKIPSKYQNIDWQTVKITPIKKTIGAFYHLVIRYDIEGLPQPIFCSAHSKEDRKNAFTALKFISNQTKNKEICPIFYSKNFKAFFYLGVDGKNLQHYIKNEPEKIEDYIKLSAAWLSNLHQTKTDPKKNNYNPLSSRIETVVPGPKVYVESIQKKAPEHLSEIKKIFNQINEFDKKNLEKNAHYLIHGDFHPENVIIKKNDSSKIVIIDYTDICISDFARDLGSFLHQLKYMIQRFNPQIADKIPVYEKSFLESYFKNSATNLNSEIEQRISIYAAWTALRNAIFFLIKGFIETDEAQKSINYTKEYLSHFKDA